MTTATRTRPPAKARPRGWGRPFTLAHFRRWSGELVLDNGERFRLEPFQEAFVRDLFAGIPECWLVIPEGNGKTTLTAAIALYHCEHRQDGMVPWAASSRDQAEIGYAAAAGFVRRSPHLRGLFKCLEGYRRIRCDRMGSRIQVFAADDRTGDGVIPTLCILDELHRHRSLGLYRTWAGKLDKRGAQIVTISTAGEPGGEFEETRELIRQSAGSVRRRGSFVRAAGDRLVLHEWAVPEGADVRDLSVVASANPFSAVTADSLARKLASPTMTPAHWARFTCNLPTRSVTAAITEVEWDAAGAGDEIPDGAPVWAGLDLAWKWDTTALVPLWVPEPEFRLLGAARILTPPRDGTSLDPARVEAALLETHERNPLHTVVMDTTSGEQLAEWIAAELGARVVDRSQGNALAALDYARFMEALRSGWLRHTGDPGLRRHALNAVARLLPMGDARFDRPRSTRAAAGQDSRVIDALVAAAMVHSTVVAELGVQPAEPWRAF